ncbi:hypothetical protein VTO73DRAFT_12008 [Trametes versicolor]
MIKTKYWVAGGVFAGPSDCRTAAPCLDDSTIVYQPDLTISRRSPVQLSTSEEHLIADTLDMVCVRRSGSVQVGARGLPADLFRKSSALCSGIQLCSFTHLG